MKRSTIVSQSYKYSLPKWFREKYKNILHFSSGTLISSKSDAKFGRGDILGDYRKALIDSGFFDNKKIMFVACLSDDGTLSRTNIEKNNITYFWHEPNEEDTIKELKHLE